METVGQDCAGINSRYVSHSHTGHYDDALLCLQCEEALSVPDDHAQRILLKSEREWRRDPDRTETAFIQLESFNYEALQRFALAVLWRAHATSHIFFEGVDLGPYSERIRQIAFGERKAGPDEFPFFLRRIPMTEKGGYLLPPLRQRIDGANFQLVCTGEFTLFVMVDARAKFPKDLGPIRAKPGQPLTAIELPMKALPEIKEIVRFGAIYRRQGLKGRWPSR